MRYGEYVEKCRKVADVQNAMAVLQWDQEVNMPPKGAEVRSNQLATLSVIAHEWSTDPAYGALLQELNEDDSLSWEQKRNVQESLRDYKRRLSYDKHFVEQLSRTVSRAFNAWQQARKKNDFNVFAPALTEIVALKRIEAGLVGYEQHPYNALMDEYEPGATVRMVDRLFSGVKGSLSTLLEKVRNLPRPVNVFAGKQFAKQAQWDLCIGFLKQMGYDFDAGRQDYAPHPFCINFSSGDVRVTTRANESDVFDMLSSSIHEGGHALYEQGLLPENYGLPAGYAISLGVHESQSRLWENNVGRSEAFWKANFEKLKQAFPEQCAGLTARDAFVANNLVQPSLIRVQADELTYHFHIMIRYELEKALITGDLQVKDLKEAWNASYKKYLDIEVPDDNRGVLQDIHWAHGSIGYFATYSLGSFYAAQYYRQAEKDIPGLAGLIEQGDFLPLKQWLNEKLHRYGRLYGAEEICTRITGEGLNYDHFHRYLEDKLSRVYIG